MFDLGQSTEMVGPIVLADPTVEHSLVISALLNIIYRYQVPPLSQTAVILYLIDLATKWEMDIVHVVIRRHLEAAFFAQNVHSLGLFTIAIKLQAIDVASKVIELEKTMTDSRPVGALLIRIYRPRPMTGEDRTLPLPLPMLSWTSRTLPKWRGSTSFSCHQRLRGLCSGQL